MLLGHNILLWEKYCGMANQNDTVFPWLQFLASTCRVPTVLALVVTLAAVCLWAARGP